MLLNIHVKYWYLLFKMENKNAKKNQITLRDLGKPEIPITIDYKKFSVVFTDED